MRAIFVALAAVVPAGSAPAAAMPALAAEGADAAAFVPRGWKLDVAKQGDVSDDGIADLVFVIQQANPADIRKNDDGLGADTIDSNPRVLVVALGRAKGGPYRLALQNGTLIPRHTEFTVDDPFDPETGLDVRRNAFTVRLDFFANAGSWSMFNNNFTFRIAGGKCVLIGFDRNWTMRNTGEFEGTSINYLTRVKRVEKGRVDSDKGRVTETRLPRRPPTTIDQIGDGLEFGG